MNAWLALPAAAAAAGLALHGPWALAGVAAGAAFGWMARRRGLGWPHAALAAALPPLAAVGPAAAAMAFLAGLLALRDARPHPAVLLLGALGVLLPLPAGVIVPAAAGALHFASAPRRLAPAGLLVALAGAVLAPLAGVAAALAASAVALAARWAVAHPANATVARRLSAVGVAALPVPALVGLGLAALGRGPEPVWSVLALAAASAGAGVVLAIAHVGMAPLLRASDADDGLWLAAVWLVPSLGMASFLLGGFRIAAESGLALLGLLAVPMAMGAAWLRIPLRAHSAVNGGTLRSADKGPGPQ